MKEYTVHSPFLFFSSAYVLHNSRFSISLGGLSAASRRPQNKFHTLFVTLETEKKKNWREKWRSFFLPVCV